MSLLSLPRELRDRILRELLYPAEGVMLVHKYNYTKNAASANDHDEGSAHGDSEDSESGSHHVGNIDEEGVISSGRDDNEWESEEEEIDNVGGLGDNGMEEDDDDPWAGQEWDSEDEEYERMMDDTERDQYDEQGILKCKLGPPPEPSVPIPTAIFFVNWQISSEALEKFYDDNVFTFDTDVNSALAFLQQTISPTARSQIRHIGLTKESINYQIVGLSHHWEALKRYLISSKRILSVTVHLPYSITHGFDSGLTLWCEDVLEQMRLLRDLLLEGNIQKLRLSYYDVRPLPQDLPAQALARLSEDYMKDNCPLIKSLKEPVLTDAVLQRRQQEWGEFRRAQREGRPTAFSSMNELFEDQMRREGSIPFGYSQEDGGIGNWGTVMVLTPPRQQH